MAKTIVARVRVPEKGAAALGARTAAPAFPGSPAGYNSRFTS